MQIEITEPSQKQALHMGKLLTYAAQIGMNCAGYGSLGYNDRSGNTYLWLEDYNFTLFISDFNGGRIEVVYSCPYDGEEIERQAPRRKETALHSLEKWASKLAEKSEAKENNVKFTLSDYSIINT